MNIYRIKKGGTMWVGPIPVTVSQDTIFESMTDLSIEMNPRIIPNLEVFKEDWEPVITNIPNQTSN